MNSEASANLPPFFRFLLGVTLFSALLVLVIALQYSYNKLTIAASGVGGLGLLTLAIFLWCYGQRLSRQGQPQVISHASVIGAILGGLWIVEISINNFIAPPLPARDRLDDGIWACIALAIFVFAGFYAYATGSVRTGLVAGAWSGLVSGAIACWMALALIGFGMYFITHDPLNVAEWTARGAANHAPTMAAYFAYETFAGAFLHLVGLGLLMGGLLGIGGGLLGKVSRAVFRLFQ